MEEDQEVELAECLFNSKQLCLEVNDYGECVKNIVSMLLAGKDYQKQDDWNTKMN